MVGAVSPVIDGVLKDWGERLFPTSVAGKRGKNIRGGAARARKAQPSIGLRAHLVTAKKAPEVLVKVSGGGRNRGAVGAHLNYISRHGRVELEDENGSIYKGREEVQEALKSWAKGYIGLAKRGEHARQAFNIVLSMPPGTSREGVHAAARQFAAEEFGKHQYVFAEHADEAHPHVHLAVKAIDKEGVRLNPRKKDLQRWRERFAAQLRDQGIFANATPRRARGVVRRGERQAVRHLRADGRQRGENGSKGREATVHAYQAIAGAPAKSGPGDRELAGRVGTFAQSMAPSASARRRSSSTMASC